MVLTDRGGLVVKIPELGGGNVLGIQRQPGGYEQE
jgi:hypothetical protein